MGPRGRLRRRRPPARRARPDDPRRGRLHAAGHQPAVQRIDRAARPLHAAGLRDSTCAWSRPTRSPPCRCAAPAIRKAHSRWSACSTRIARRARPRSRGGSAAQSRAAGKDALRLAAQDALRLADRARQRRLSAAASASRSTRSTMPALPSAKRRARAEGRYLGIGIGNGVKGTGRGPFESGIVRIGRSGPHLGLHRRHADGARASAPRWRKSAPSSSTSRRTASAVVAGDTAVIPYGQGGFASRQTVTAGSAVHLAAVAVRDKALQVAAHLLEASVERSRDCATGGSRSPARRAAG